MKNTQKGITLIALIITIIVMLILVGVSVSIALNTGLFKAAQGAAKNTEAHKINETAISNGTVTVGNTTDSIENIVNSYKGGIAESGPIDLTNGGQTQYIMSIDGEEFKIDENTTWAQLINANVLVESIKDYEYDSAKLQIEGCYIVSGFTDPELGSYWPNPIAAFESDSWLLRSTLNNSYYYMVEDFGVANSSADSEEIYAESVNNKRITFTEI